MKYPQLVSTPAVVKEWLEAELECLGIDSAAYARTILSLLSRDTIDPAEVIQSGYVLVANKGGRGGAGGLGGPHPPRTREEELKRAEVVECLRSASEDHGGIQLLVDQLISMLKQLPAASEPSADTARAHTDSSSRRRPAARDAHQTQSQSDDPVLRYEAAFPALRRESPGVIPLTYFSKMTRSAAPSGGGLWRADLPPSAAAWPTTLDQLRLLLPPPPHHEEHTAPLEPAGCGAPAHAPPPPPPKPPEPPVTAETTRVIRPSAETHFQPIRRCSGSDGAEEPAAPPATYDARLYLRSDSGGLYLEDEPAAAGGRSAAEPPQKYMMFRERNTLALHRGLTPKFKLSCNEKYCQTDGDGSEAAAGVGRDLLQLLVSEEQADEAARGGMASDGEDEDDPSSEVLSSLQQTLHSIYEDGSDAADSGAEPEPADTLPLPAERWRGVLAVPRRPSAFARVRRRSPAHRPLYLRGGGADSLLAAVYVGGDWSPAELPAVSQPSDHRPLYARQPPAAATTSTTTTAPAEFAEHRQLSSGRISDTVYCQRPTEYPALRYQLAGRDRPEVTFCRLGGDTHSAKYVLLKDDSVASAAWDTISDAARSSREASVASDGAADATLWQAACEHEPCDRSADGALWEARAHAGLLGRRRSSPDSAIWEQEPAGGVWEAPSSLVEPEEGCQLGALWEGTCGRPETDISGGGGAETAGQLWETPRDLAGTELTPEHITSISGIRHHHALENTNIGGTRHHPGLERALELTPDLATSIGGARHHHALEQAPENTTLGGVCHHLVPEHGSDHTTLGGRRRSCADRDSSVEMTIWEPLEDQAERTDTAHGSNIWESATAPSSQHVSLDALWPVRELGQREMSVEDPRWELEEPVPPRDQSAAEEDARWHVPRRQERACSSERDLWASQAELAQRDTSVEKTIWESGEEPAPRSDTSAERALWEPSGVHAPPPAPWSVPDGLPPGESALWPADAPLWEGSEETPGWSGWKDDTPIRAPDHIWRRADPPATTSNSEWSSGEALPAVTSDGDSSSEQVRRLLWRLGGDDVLSQTGQYPADAASDAGRSWEFIDEHNVKNKIEAQVVSDGGPLASELADGEGEGGGWRVLPALRQLSERLGLTDGAPPLPDGVALNAWALEEQWRRDDGPQRPTLDRRVRRSDRKRPCSYFMEGNCKRNDCKFSHDLSAITCVFWEESGCFKGVHCPFLHGYPADDDEGEDSSDSAKRAVPKKSFKLEKEDFPSLHNMKKWHRNEDDDNRKAGRRSCRRHKSFSEATLGVGSGDPEPPRPAIGGRGKRRRHHSKSEGVRPSDTGARRP